MVIKQEPWWMVAVVITAMVVGISQEAPTALAQPPEALLVERYKWYDADTAIDALVRLPYGVPLEGSIRAVDYDAWELGNRGYRGGGPQIDDEERERARRALEGLRKLSEGGSLFIVPIPPGTRDNQGRILGRFFIRRASGEVVDIRQWAVSNNHVRKVIPDIVDKR